jgi:hypothetical protein
MTYNNKIINLTKQELELIIDSLACRIYGDIEEDNIAFQNLIDKIKAQSKNTIDV